MNDQNEDTKPKQEPVQKPEEDDSEGTWEIVYRYLGGGM